MLRRCGATASRRPCSRVAESGGGTGDSYRRHRCGAEPVPPADGLTWPGCTTSAVARMGAFVHMTHPTFAVRAASAEIAEIPWNYWSLFARVQLLMNS